MKQKCTQMSTSGNIRQDKMDSTSFALWGEKVCHWKENDWPHPHLKFQTWPGHGKMIDPPHLYQNFRFGLDMERWLTPLPLHKRPFTCEGNSLVLTMRGPQPFFSCLAHTHSFTVDCVTHQLPFSINIHYNTLVTINIQYLISPCSYRVTNSLCNILVIINILTKLTHLVPVNYH